MTDPWRDPEKYKTGRRVRCVGCGETCRETHWGKWCFDCNVERIDRIDKAFDKLTS
ncbi:hypothetical protein [Bradyrhizobium sp. SZCCHNRI2010]|uniref:hypothetical protein n=1 Tax=Bradyrhizobium sp. SZCCHNRI2010 TaxID=3057283 RepID=UPI0028E4E70A|nr:hypothetical protein [Bradyrhizobium sp. SZCCHNRI2010]